MINSAAEARKDIENHKINKCDCYFPGGGICDHMEAQSYLAALNGPECRALVETLEKIPQQVLEMEKKNPAWSKSEIWGIERDVMPAISLCILQAIAKYHEATK